MFVPFSVVVLLVMDRVVEGEAVDVATHTGCDDSCVIVGNRNLLHVVGKGE